MILFLTLAQLILPVDFPGSNPTPFPPPSLAKVYQPDGSWNLHMIAHPEWDRSLYADWLPQTPPVQIQPGDVLRLEWSYVHSTFRPVKFRLWLDGAVLKNFVPADLTLTPATPIQNSPVVVTTKDGVIPPFTAAQIGSHTLALTVYDAAGTGGTPESESPQGEASFPVQVSFTGPPPAPTGFRIVVIKLALAADGTLKLISVTEEKQ